MKEDPCGTETRPRPTSVTGYGLWGSEPAEELPGDPALMFNKRLGSTEVAAAAAVRVGRVGAGRCRTLTSSLWAELARC